MASNIDNLNFKVILDDKDFNTRVEKDIELAKKLNVELSQLLQAKVKVNAISATEAASAKRASDILTKQATNQEKVSQAKAKTAEAEEKVATQAAKTAKEMERSKAAASQTAVNVQRLATEQQRTTAATQNAAAATSRAALAQRRLRDYASQTTNTIRTQNRLMSELKGYALGYLSIHGATQLISSLVRVTGEFELQKTTLAAMLGDLNEAEQIITRIQGLAVESPFQFKELTTYAKQLSAFSVPAEELYETTKMLADVSAGLGVGMDRIVLAYGQVRSAAFLRGQEVRQFTEAGIPILDELAKQFTELEGRAVSTGEVFDKISARLVPFEMVAKVFKDMTSEGGKFYQMQEVQAETLRGKISNLKDAYEVMLNEIGSAHSNKLKGAVDGVRRLLQNWESIGRTLVDLIKLFGAYKIAVGVLAISDTIAKFGSLAKAIRSTAIAQRVLNSAMMTNPYIAFGMAVMTVALAIRRQRQELYDTTRAQQDYNERVKDLERAERERVNNVRNLIDLVQDETQATLEREAALLSLKESYPEIFEQYDIETIKLADILRIKKQIAEEDAKQKKLGALGAIAGQQGRINVRIAQGAGDNIIESELKYLREMQKDFLKRYVLPELVAGLKGLSNEELQKELDKAFRGSEYGKIGLESFYDVPTSQDFYKDLYSAIQAEIKRRNNVKLAEGWRKKIQDTLTDMGLDAGTSFGLWTTESTQSVEYVDDMVKRYKELAEQIKMVSSFDKEQTKRLQQNKDAIEAVSKALGINIKELAASKSEKAESVAERQLKAEIDLVKKLQDAYEKLRPYVDDKTMKSTLSKFFPEARQEWIDSLDFTTVLKALADEMEQYDTDAAERLRNAIGKTGVDAEVDRLKNLEKSYKASAKAAGDYFEQLRKWASEDFNINGEGIVLDISKIASDLNGKMDEIDLRAAKAQELFSQIDIDSEDEIAKVKEIFIKEFGADAWDEFWNAYYTDGLEVIDALAEKQKEKERALSQEKVNDLAEKYVKEQYFNESIKLDDLGDKTLSQIRGIRKKLQDILSEDPLAIPAEIELRLADIGVSPEDLTGVNLDVIYEAFEHSGEPMDDATKSVLALIQQIQQAGLSTEKFGEIIRKVFEEDLEELTEEERKLLADMVMQYMNQLQSLFKSIGEFAESVGNDSLRAATNGLQNAMDVLGPMAEKFAKGDWVGGIISGVTTLASKIFEAINAQHQLAKAIEETAIQQRILNSEYAIMQGVEGAWGENTYKKFTNAYQEAAKAYKDMQEDLKKQNKVLFGNEKNDSNGWGFAGGLAGGAALGAAIGSIFPGIGTAIGAGVGALIGAFVGGVTDVAMEADNYAKSLKEMAEDIGAPLINEETGGYNLETLKTIKETYENLSDEDAAWLDQAIANTEIYENALTSMADNMSSVFGNVADDIADAFITSFKESGEAALEYGDIMDGLATQIAKDIMKATLLENIFTDELAQEIAKKLASGDTAGAMAAVDEVMQAAQDLAPYLQEFLEGIEPYFEMEGQSTSDMGEGIKGITEDTASLLASYINAMRADLSMLRGMQAKYLPAIGESVPTIMDHLAQIQANTYNTAVSNASLLDETRAILGELRSVITTDSGDTAIRVYS